MLQTLRQRVRAALAAVDPRDRDEPTEATDAEVRHQIRSEAN